MAEKGKNATAKVRLAKVMFLDLETFPNIAYVWGKYDQNIIRYIKQTCICTFSAKWQGSSKIISRGLDDYKGYKPQSYDDSQLVNELWQLFDEADIIVAHNGDQFDIKVAQARFVVHGLKPPTPYKTVDTKKAFKLVFKFNSNKLDDIGELLKLGRKIKTDFDLWEGCINGDPKSWKTMKKYNDYDVVVLEKAYDTVLPWVFNHPNIAPNELVACPKCGSENVQWRGVQRSITREYARFQCQDCGGWGKVQKSNKAKVLVNNVGR